MSDPTPIADKLAEYEPWQIFGVFAFTAMLTTFAVEQFHGPIWMGAGASVASVIFGGYVCLHFGWVRFKQWYYPSHYRSE